MCPTYINNQYVDTAKRIQYAFTNRYPLCRSRVFILHIQNKYALFGKLCVKALLSLGPSVPSNLRKRDDEQSHVQSLQR